MARLLLFILLIVASRAVGPVPRLAVGNARLPALADKLRAFADSPGHDGVEADPFARHTVGSDAAVGDSVYVFSSGVRTPGGAASAQGSCSGRACGDSDTPSDAPSAAPPRPTKDSAARSLSLEERRAIASAHNVRGAEASQRGDWREAHAAFSSALALTPDDSALMGNWALAQGGMGDVGAMEETLRRMVAMFPAERKDALVTLGRVLTVQARHKEALHTFQRAAAALAPTDPPDWAVSVNVATSLNLLRDPSCLDHYLGALRIDPVQEGTWNNLGSAVDSMPVPRRITRALEREFGVGVLEHTPPVDNAAQSGNGNGKDDGATTVSDELPAGAVQWDKSEACFTRMQELSLRALNRQIRTANRSARLKQQRPRCLVRAVADWDRGTERGVVVTPYVPLPRRKGQSSSSSSSSGGGDPVDAIAEAASVGGVGWGVGGGYLYGSGLPGVMDQSELRGFRLSASPLLRYHNMMFAEKRVFTAVFRDMVVAGKAGVVQDACRAFLDSHGGYVWLDEHHGFPANKALPLVRLERAASVMQMSGQLYFHWLLECLPRLMLMQPLLEQDASIALIVPSGLGRVAESLELLGWPLRARVPGGGDALVERRIVYYAPLEARYAVGELHVADWRVTDERPTQAFMAPRVALVALRAALASSPLLSRLHEEMQQRQGLRPLRLVYTSRRGNLQRTDKLAPRIVANEVELVGALVSAMPDGEAAISIVRGGEITLAQTVALFSSADIVVGAFGGTLANAVFCRPRAQLVEIALREPAYRTYMHLAAAMGLGYWVTTDIPDNSFSDTLHAPVEKVREIVEHLVGTMGQAHS